MAEVMDILVHVAKEKREARERARQRRGERLHHRREEVDLGRLVQRARLGRLGGLGRRVRLRHRRELLLLHHARHDRLLEHLLTHSGLGRAIKVHQAGLLALV